MNKSEFTPGRLLSIPVRALVLFALLSAGSVRAQDVVRLQTAETIFSEGIGIVLVAMSRTGTDAGPQVTIQTVDVTTSGAADYEPINETFTFNENETNVTLVIIIKDNPVFQPDRVFKLQLSNPVGITLGTPSETLMTIADNDDAARPGPGAAGRNPLQGTFAVATNSTGQIFLGGDFTTFNGSPRNNLVAISADGALDPGVNLGTGPNDRVWSLAVESDGRILIGGDFTAFNGTSVNRLARLTAGGQVDPQFNPGAGANGLVESIEVQPDNRILIAGFFSEFDNVARNDVALLESNGTLVSGFNPTTPASFIGHTARRSGDHVLLGGEVDLNISGANVTNSLMRFDLAGVRDTSFQVSVGNIFFNRITGMVVQPDGKIVIVGLFPSVNGTASSCIARLNPNGTVDPGFLIGAGADNWVVRLSLQPDGKILIGGFFKNVQGQPRSGIARLNANGTLDTAFNPQGGANDVVYQPLLHPDGRVLVSGIFTKFNGYDRFRFAQLSGEDGALETEPLRFENVQIVGGDIRARLLVEPGRDYRIGVTEDFVSMSSISTNRTARRSVDWSRPKGAGAPAFFQIEQGY